LPSVQHTTEEDNPTDKHLHLSTADPLAGGFYPWLSFESARWLTFKPEVDPVGWTGIESC